MLSPSPQVVKYDPKYRTAFAEMNSEWIQKYFTLEPADVRQLENPEDLIISPGGEIFFILEGERAVGTCAMIASGPGRYELAKMAVVPEMRGKHYGDLLMKSVLSWAREKKANEVFLLSNTDLEPAIALYLKSGFEVASLGKHPDYERCNIHMVKTL